tara:strand:+ start:281 stop:463 length:183 start_codon:yes stop_codon:yes gene_type:complete
MKVGDLVLWHANIEDIGLVTRITLLGPVIYWIKDGEVNHHGPALDGRIASGKVEVINAGR